MNPVIKFDVDEDPLFVRPQLLTHPHIPSAMSGINPRTILGKDWWDVVRKKAYMANNLCCWACGEHSGTDEEHPAIEAHEAYVINYRERQMVLQEVVALCHKCHLFIHSGLLMTKVDMGEIDKEYAKSIIETRMVLLHKANLKPFYATRAVQLLLAGTLPVAAKLIVFKEKLPRPEPAKPHTRWHLVLGGERYYGKT